MFEFASNEEDRLVNVKLITTLSENVAVLWASHIQFYTTREQLYLSLIQISSARREDL